MPEGWPQSSLVVALFTLAALALLLKVIESRLGRRARRPGRSSDLRQQSSATPLPEVFPYRRTSGLLTPAKCSSFGVLQQAVGDRYLLSLKIRLADLLDVPPGTPRWRTHFNRISAKHIDIVCCDPRSPAPLLAIELDDVSHQ